MNVSVAAFNKAGSLIFQYDAYVENYAPISRILLQLWHDKDIHRIIFDGVRGNGG